MCIYVCVYRQIYTVCVLVLKYIRILHRIFSTDKFLFQCGPSFINLIWCWHASLFRSLNSMLLENMNSNFHISMSPRTIAHTTLCNVHNPPDLSNKLGWISDSEHVCIHFRGLKCSSAAPNSQRASVVAFSCLKKVSMGWQVLSVLSATQWVRGISIVSSAVL